MIIRIVNQPDPVALVGTTCEAIAKGGRTGPVGSACRMVFDKAPENWVSQCIELSDLRNHGSYVPSDLDFLETSQVSSD